MRRLVQRRLTFASGLAMGLIGVALGIAVALAVNSSDATSPSTPDGEVVGFNYRAMAGAPDDLPGERVLDVGGLTINVSCRTFGGSPVVGSSATSSVNHASLGWSYDTRHGEHHSFVRTNFGEGELGFLGPIPAGDANTGTLTYVRPDGGSVTATFLAMNGAPGTDCVFAGTAQSSSGSE